MTAIEPLQQAAPFVGRRTEIERIAALVDRVVTARGGAFVLIEGEPGIGKTSLLHSAVGMAATAGMRVLLGAATEADQSIPGAAIGSCVALGDRSGSTDGYRLGSLFEDADPRRPVSELAATAAISDLLSQWCADGPVAVLVDDIHWADAASLSVLRWLGVAVDTMPLLVVVAMRPYPLGPGLPRLLSEFDAVGARRMSLGPLADADVTRLVEQSLGTPPGPQLDALIAGAAGNPLYLTDLLHSQTSVEPGAGLSDALAVTIARRLDFLPESARHTLEVAAALTPRIDPVKLAEILGISLIDVWNEIRTAVEARVLVHDGDELVFRHDLIRRVLAEQVSPSIRATLRRHVEVAGLHLMRIAEPATGAGETTRPATPPMAAVDRVAELISGTVAAAAAESLVESLSAPSDPTTVRLFRGLADGDVDVVAETVAEFARSERPRFAALAGENLAEMLVRNGRTAEARTALETAVRRYEELGAVPETARVQARLRELGVRRGVRGPRGPRGRPKTGWDALTVTEEKVAVQVAQGCSNAEIAEKMFLSRRTVQTHVSNILSKLGLRSRVQVAVAYAQRR
ncbi:AAA family ATPase [Nocardia sp. CA2R105]|uniref:helix-turn-helix transcriptional regulator n=1 Tax=Nocardia coffeae TaxID=2873381 RepID=UPI001CA7744F|nr:LuxR family transcriptional regulator [Nocardia coffeae]MBY8862777.1 AAA family ATPase [Nocardia coffeae]